MNRSDNAEVDMNRFGHYANNGEPRRGDQPGLGVMASTPTTALEVPFESAGPEQRGVEPTPTSAAALRPSIDTAECTFVLYKR